MSKNEIKNMMVAWLETKYTIKSLKYLDSIKQYGCDLSRYEVKIDNKYYIVVTNYEKEIDELLISIQDRKGKVIDYWSNKDFNINLNSFNKVVKDVINYIDENGGKY